MLLQHLTTSSSAQSEFSHRVLDLFLQLFRMQHLHQLSQGRRSFEPGQHDFVKVAIGFTLKMKVEPKFEYTRV